ncbi:hypothetical protein [Pseudonocardia sp.]
MTERRALPNLVGDRAHRVAQDLDVGLARVDSWWLRDLRSPLGGQGDG